MKLVLLLMVTLAALTAVPVALAFNESKPLQLRPDKAALAGAIAAHNNAPFVTPIDDPVLDLMPPRDLRQDQSRSSCTSQAALCYDTADGGRIVYKPARNFMPDLPGFTRENISVRRDRIVFRYSF